MFSPPCPTWEPCRSRWPGVTSAAQLPIGNKTREPATLLDGFSLRDASWTRHLHISPLGPLVVRAEIPEDPSASPLHLSGSLVLSPPPFLCCLLCSTEYISTLSPGHWVRCLGIIVVQNHSWPVRLILADAHNLILPSTLDTRCFNCFFFRDHLHSSNVLFIKESLAFPPDPARFITDLVHPIIQPGTGVDHELPFGRALTSRINLV